MSELSVSGQFDCAVGAGSVTDKNSISGAPVRAYNIAQRYWNAHLRAKTFDSRDMPSPDDWCALCDTYCSSDPPYETYLKYFSTNLEFVYPTSFARHVCEGLRNDLSWSTIFSTCVCVKN